MAQLGIVTYNIAKNWDLPTILDRLEKLGYEGVELRTFDIDRVPLELGLQKMITRRKGALRMKLERTIWLRLHKGA